MKSKHPTAPVRLGFLYPGYAAEDDYPRAGRILGSGVDLRVVHTTIGEDVHREEALRDTGSLGRLLSGAEELSSHDVASVVWACTSGSFVFGLDGARDQAAALERASGLPSSSTSLAFVDALSALDVRTVAIAATYPDDVAAMFVDFLAAAGVDTVHVGALGIITGVEVGTIDAAAVEQLARDNDVADAQALLLPDTALHTIGWIPELEAAVDKIVLTANQVTVWQALRLARVSVPSTDALGRLFASPVPAR